MNDKPAQHQTTAEKIADYLFTNAFGEQADRLVLELNGKRNGGGWCRAAVVSAVECILKEHP